MSGISFELDSALLKFQSRFATLTALILLIVGTLTPIVAYEGILRVSEIPRSTHFVPTNTLGYSGIGPTSISVNWTESTDSTFYEYILKKYSTLLNGFETIANILDRTTTAYFSSGLVANSSGLWQLEYRNQLTSEYSNTLTVTQPPTANLTYVLDTATSVRFQWNNTARYGGMLSFGLYQLMESVNGGAYFAVRGSTDVGSLSDAINNLSVSTNYSFYLNTTDQCVGNGCPSESSSSSLSNTVTISTPGLLLASAQAIPLTVDVGQPANFDCTGAGGLLPYAYSWTFGDGSSGTGATPSHTYSATGKMNAFCTVTDSFGTTANSQPISLPVYIDPSIKYFTLTPANIELGQRITFLVSTSGGNGSLTFSYSHLPTGCSSVNSSSFSCTPTSIGTYDVTVAVTDQGLETANSTIRLSIAPPLVLGLPQTIGLAVIFGSILGICSVAILSVVLALRRKRGLPNQGTRARYEQVLSAKRVKMQSIPNGWFGASGGV